MSEKLEWREIEAFDGRYQSTQRAKVPGGWLIRVISEDHNGVGLTFYPDKENKWSPKMKESVT